MFEFLQVKPSSEKLDTCQNDSILLKTINLLQIIIDKAPESATLHERMIFYIWNNCLFPTEESEVNSMSRWDDLKCWNAQTRKAAFSLLISLCSSNPSLLIRLLKNASSVVSQGRIPIEWDGIDLDNFVKHLTKSNLNCSTYWGAVIVLLKSNTAFL